MKINQCKTDEEVNKYFQTENKKLCKKFGFNDREMDTINAYCRANQELLEKCGERMTKLKTQVKPKTK